MFLSLSHPARRKILRMLAEKPRNFSTMLETLGISSSHLTYHLENLGELLTKLDDGRYKLSAFGEAAVMTMRGVEETPETQQRRLTLPLKWKSVFAALMIGVIILAAVSYAQYMSLDQLSCNYKQMSDDYGLLEADYEEVSAENERLLSWGTSTSKVRAFLTDVVHLDMTKYVANLEGNLVEYRSDWDGIVEELVSYSLTYEGSKLAVTLKFRDTTLSSYYLHVNEGTPYYSQLQPNNILDSAKALLERYQTYSGASHLAVMRNLLESVDDIGDSDATSGNVKLITTTEASEVKIQFVYTSDNVDFQAKKVELIFDNYGFLQSLSDDWTLYKAGSTEVNIAKEEAINIAVEYAKNYSWTVDGEVINNFTLVEESVKADLWPHSREEPLVLIPYWYVEIYLDREYPDRVDRLAVGLWADTGEVSICQTLSW
jgi:hypothetical protein